VKTYFDSNVYGFVDRCSELSEVASFLRQRHTQLLGSGENLMELARTPDPGRRRTLLRTLTGLVTHRLPPLGFIHAKELVTEVRRCHPEWLRAKPDQGALNQWLNADRELWRRAKREHDLPQVDEYNDLVRAAAGELKRQQREARESLGSQVKHRVFTELQADFVWRFEAHGIWSHALFGRVPAMRDYYDYFTSYVDLTRIEPLAWQRFWQDEIRSNSVPGIKLSNLAAQFQQAARATTGNAGDINHVTFMSYSHAFLTADRGLFEVLLQLVPYHGRLARVAFVDQRTSSAFAEISAALQRPNR
jgi:hypothetical protein